MQRLQIILSISGLLNGVLLFWIYDQAQKIKFWRGQSRHNRELFIKNAETLDRITDNPLVTVPAEIVQRITDLENENAALRSDVETGCKIIEKQNGTVNGQRETINRLVNENRRFLSYKKR